MNKQTILLISIFAITFIIGIAAILVSTNFINANNKKTPSSSTRTTNASIPALPSVSLVCTSTASNKSLTVTWTSPTNVPGTYVVKGQINDASTQAQPLSFGPLPVSQGYYVFDQANGLDTYFASLWIEDSSQNKGTSVSTNQVNSALCSSGTLPTSTGVSSTALPSGVTASPTTTPAASALSCNNFSLTQNGNTLTTSNVAVKSSAVTITSGITSLNNGTLNYSSVQWSINPTTPALSVASDNTNATWTPPSDTSGGTSYTISLSGVVDSNGGTLSAPCTVTINLSSSGLPNTAGPIPTIVMLIAGLLISIAGGILFLKKES